jgi:flagellum-specific peptidoglycan hydrolase FlgJ
MAKKDRNSEKEDRYLTLIGIFIGVVFMFWLLFFYTLPAYSYCLIQPRHEVAHIQKSEKEKFITIVKLCLVANDNYPNSNHYIPEKLALAQAIVESNWGNSRFAKEGNALFGIKTWNLNEPHIKPLGSPNANFGLKSYKSYCHSVKDYLRLLNTSPHYEGFRKARDSKASMTELTEELRDYAENPHYPRILMKIIKEVQNF